MGKRFLSKTDFATAVGVSLSSLNRGIKAGRWPYSQHIHLGARVLFPASLLDELEDRARQVSLANGGTNETN
jgi:hypothetical protein